MERIRPAVLDPAQSTLSNRIHRVSLGVYVALILAAGAWAQSPKIHRVVWELTSDSPEQWQATLNNVENLQKAFGKENTELEVVAHGKGLQALLKANTSSGERIAAIAASGVRFAACSNSMRRLGVTKADLLPAAQPVDSGVAEVVRKQEAGWAYLKGGG